MKKTLALLLILALACCFAACGQETAVGPVEASTVDELLAAIAPGAEIVLAEGEFALSTASDYGKSESEYYTWNDLGAGEYELTIQGVDGLTIRGAGKGTTTLIADSRWANVLSLEGCSSVTLTDMTLGHREQVDLCEGGVVRLGSSKDVTLQGLGLYGCGTLGVMAFQSENVTVADCEIYECSLGAIQLSSNQNVTISGTEFHSFGGDQPVQEIFGIWENTGVTISGCSISDSYVQDVFLIQGGADITLEKCRLNGVQISSSVYNLQTEGVVLKEMEYGDNELRNWYSSNSLTAVDAAGEPVAFEDETQEQTAPAPAVAAPVSTGEQTEVHVKTADEFLKALAPDTCIILDSELIIFSDATGYGTETGEYYYWEDNFDGPSLVIRNLSNLTVMAEGEDRGAHTLSAIPRYANVLTFENCSAITLSGFTGGHTEEPGACMGGVFQLRNCEDILVENCGMFGCGTMGVDAINTLNLQVINSEIYECSVTGIQLDSCENVTIAGTLIRDISNDWMDECPYFELRGSKNVTVDGQPLDSNYVGR